MAELASAALERSSSQLSHTSSKSSKTKSRTRPRKSHSNASSIISPRPDPSLTSFPSLTPDAPIDAVKEPTQTKQPRQQPPPNRTVSQRHRERRATLKGLTNNSPPLTGRSALFEDSPRSSLDVPGALHLASDDHISRLIARTGAVKIVRQFAQDLAQRDAEISALRIRVDQRERELKRMLRELEVSTGEIEKRLQNIEFPEEARGDRKPDGLDTNGLKRAASTLDGMMQEALAENVGRKIIDTSDTNMEDVSATLRPVRSEVGIKSRKSTGESTKDSPNSTQGWQGQIWGSNTNSRKTSTNSSLISQETEQTDSTAKPRQSSSSRRKGLNNLFQPPAASGTSYFIGGTKGRPGKKSQNNDDASVHSKQSTKSMTSWTMRLFGGNTQATKDGLDADASRPRSSSVGLGVPNARKPTTTAAESAMAALAKSVSHIGHSDTPKATSFKPTSKASGTIGNTSQTIRRVATVVGSTEITAEPAKFAKPEDIGPVEMDAIIPTESKPPTMTQTNNSRHVEGLLTDRFGFIYDQRQRKKREDALSAVKDNTRVPGVESLGNYRRESDAGDDLAFPDARPGLIGKTSPQHRPATPVSLDERADSGQPKKWQDYLKISNLSRPTELLLHTPSAGAIVTVNTADASGMMTPPSARSASITVGGKKVLPSASSPAEPNITFVVASTGEATGSDAKTAPGTPSADPSSPTRSLTDQEPVKLLLDRLTELHDTLQAEKEAKWNEFLRKVRAERSSSSATDRPSRVNNAPEAEIVNGELIGIATLGRPNKSNRNKYVQFKNLVLQGIPVSLRPKIWSECSGATARRSPGYYDELVSRCEVGSDLDGEIVSQINADIGRTLTDNTFFRHGPGVARLKTLLLAYSLHNPSVGYCQGMNLITASLLLIMQTSEDAFWILVAIIENILPSGYFDRGLLVSRADQVVLREYVSEVLPKLGAQFEELGVELEACSFMWFLSLFTGCLSAEALYRVWDVVLCLNSSDAGLGANNKDSISMTMTMTTSASSSALVEQSQPPSQSQSQSQSQTTLPTTSHPEQPGPPASQPGTSSPFLFQLCLALLKLNEPHLLALDSAAAVYSYVNHNMTNHAISIDGLIAASEGLRKVVKREDVLARRARAVEAIGG